MRDDEPQFSVFPIGYGLVMPATFLMDALPFAIGGYSGCNVGYNYIHLRD